MLTMTSVTVAAGVVVSFNVGLVVVGLVVVVNE